MNQTPTERASRWLAQFGSAVAAPDVAGAAALFHDESYWRDLVSFTWNIKTMEGAGAIGAMLDATAARIRPSGWSLVDEATEVDGAVEAWFRFETALSRGIGHLRLKGERCLTLLTTMLDIKGHEEPAGAARATGVTHGAFKRRQNWLDRRKSEASALGRSVQP